MKYRLKSPIISVARGANQALEINRIPKGAVIDLPDITKRVGLIETNLGTRTVTFFVQDVLERGELIDTATA